MICLSPVAGLGEIYGQLLKLVKSEITTVFLSINTKTYPKTYPFIDQSVYKAKHLNFLSNFVLSNFLGKFEVLFDSHRGFCKNRSTMTAVNKFFCIIHDQLGNKVLLTL